MAGYRDKSGKYTEKRFFLERVEGQTLIVVDRETNAKVASSCSNDMVLWERIVDLLNIYGLTDAPFLGR